MPVLLKNATYIDWKTLEFSRKNILAEEKSSSVTFIDDIEEAIGKYKPEVIDCNGKLVTKSFAVGHHHAYSALSRGMGALKKSPENFYEILKYVWWTLDKCLDPEMIEASALMTAIACAKAGSTFVIDHHASPHSVKGSLEIIAGAFEKVGVSHLLCYEISDRDGHKVAVEGLEETASYLEHHQGLVGLHASFTVRNDTLKKAVEMMNSYHSGIHIHVAEDNHDQDVCLMRHGKRVVQRLSEAGALHSSKTLLVHCLHLEDNEREIIRKSQAWVVQNSESNLNNNVGYFNGAGLGEKILLGTDGMHSDMLQSAKAAFFVGQRYDTISYSSTYDRFRNVHRYLNDNHFTSDGDNSLVVLDYDPPTPLNSNNFFGHFIFGITSNHVRDVISGGRLIVRDRELTTINEADVLTVSRKQAERLWKKMKDIH
ncbi:MAG TPA: amidohydrolase family protein [Bacteroidales bacterium]|nr:amidohydrolase family protein [Bacteroidales bacterium]